MRAIWGELRLGRKGIAVCILAVLTAPPGHVSRAQDGSPVWNIPLPQRRTPLGQRPEDNDDTNIRHAQKEAARQRNLLRHKRIVSDTERIVVLARELTVDLVGREEPASAAKKAEEIEKLARGVKNRMKGD